MKRLNAARRLALFIALATPLSALAQAYPTKPVRVIMTVGAGADLMARMIGQKVGDAIGQPLVTEIQSAAGGSIGTDMVARAAPDGTRCSGAAKIAIRGWRNESDRCGAIESRCRSRRTCC